MVKAGGYSSKKFIDTVLYGAVFGLGFIAITTIVKYLNASVGSPIPGNYLTSEEYYE